MITYIIMSIVNPLFDWQIWNIICIVISFLRTESHFTEHIGSSENIGKRSVKKEIV